MDMSKIERCYERFEKARLELESVCIKAKVDSENTKDVDWEQIPLTRETNALLKGLVVNVQAMLTEITGLRLEDYDRHIDVTHVKSGVKFEFVDAEFGAFLEHNIGEIRGLIRGTYVLDTLKFFYPNREVFKKQSEFMKALISTMNRNDSLKPSSVF